MSENPLAPPRLRFPTDASELVDRIWPASATRTDDGTLAIGGISATDLVAQFGASQLMLGTDYPFNFHESAPLAALDAAGLGADPAAQLTDGNARRFLARAFVATATHKEHP